MKTDKSSIKRKLGETLVDLAIAKVNVWTVKELSTLGQKSDYPICLKITDTEYWVGNHKISNLGQNCWRVSQHEKVIHDFYSQQAAMFYCVFFKCKLYKAADGLLNSDKRVSLADNEYRFYTAKLSKNPQKIDEFKHQLYTVKQEEAKIELEFGRQELQKSLEQAKYMKVWELLL